MTSTYELEIDLVAVALTKPATQFGVPQLAFYSNLLICLLGWMVYQAVSGGTGIFSTVMAISLGFFFHAAMYFMTFHDPFGLTIAWLNATHFRKHPTRSIWGNTDSFSS
jgi:type IV secretory pathway VirB3-like protein